MPELITSKRTFPHGMYFNRHEFVGDEFEHLLQRLNVEAKYLKDVQQIWVNFSVNSVELIDKHYQKFLTYTYKKVEVKNERCKSD